MYVQKYFIKHAETKSPKENFFIFRLGLNWTSNSQHTTVTTWTWWLEEIWFEKLCLKAPYAIGPIVEFSEMFNCWERRWIDVDGASHRLSATAAIFSVVRTVFGFSSFGLSMRTPVSFIFFHKITNIWSWRCFFSSKIRMQFSHTFCNITMIFKVMSQYFPDVFKRIHDHIRLAEGYN